MSQSRFDLIVIGGGIHGLMIALHASEAGRRTALFDAGRIGSGTTAGWFGILHGGLRYLQSLDVKRFRTSLADSRWFAMSFPELVTRQAFLMPLYNRGLKRPSVFRGAFLTERLLGLDRNRGVAASLNRPMGQVIGPDRVSEICPSIIRDGLTGGAVWEELVVPNRPALMDALLARAKRSGLQVFEQTRVLGIELQDARLVGVQTDDTPLLADRVVNATGPNAMAFARNADPNFAGPIACPALAFNLTLDCPSPASIGLALPPADGSSDMMFVYPTPDGTFAGTAYLPFQKHTKSEIDQSDAEMFRARLEAALPGAGLGSAQVSGITSGMLPALTPGGTDLIDRDILFDHGANGGPQGLFSVWGVKFTTAPHVARRVLRKL